MSTLVPNPGSDSALEQGCICPVDSNRHGLGTYWKGYGNLRFHIVQGCPLHDSTGALGAEE